MRIWKAELLFGDAGVAGSEVADAQSAKLIGQGPPPKEIPGG